MQRYLPRRAFLAKLAVVGVAAGTTGCGGSPAEIVEEASTPDLQYTKVALRGYQIVAFRVGEKLVELPHSAVRILGAFLMITAAGSELVIEYLDDELQRRDLREAVSEQVRIEIERQKSVTFITENGDEEQVELGENRYDDQAEE